jgi:hypothetical protein
MYEFRTNLVSRKGELSTVAVETREKTDRRVTREKTTIEFIVENLSADPAKTTVL